MSDASLDLAKADLEHDLKGLHDQAPCGYLCLLDDGTIVKANQTFLLWTGYSQQEILGRRFQSLLSRAGAIYYDTHFSPLLRMQTSVTGVTFDMIRRHGSMLPALLNASVVEEPSRGRIIHITIFDATDRRSYEQELLAARRRAERLARIVQASSDAIITLSIDRIVEHWNAGAEKAFGYTSAEANGHTIDKLIVPEDRIREFVTAFDKTVRERLDMRMETICRHKEGWLIDVSLSAVPHIEPPGEVVAVSAIIRDISDLRRTQAAMLKLEKLATAARFTADLEQRNAEILRQSEQVRELSWRLLRAQDEERRHIARELHDSAGQTLTVLGMNLVQLVQKAARSNPEVASDAEAIQEMVQQLHRDIRTASYLLHPPLLDESGLYSALSWYTQGLFERSGLQIGLEMPQEFGRLSRDVELVVFRLVQECLTNIHRHSESKVAGIRIGRDATQVVVEIRDQGKGMSAERLAEVQAGASGVGIRGMRERLRQFNGDLKIESDNTGTRILVTIPVSTGLQESRKSESLGAGNPAKKVHMSDSPSGDHNTTLSSERESV